MHKHFACQDLWTIGNSEQQRCVVPVHVQRGVVVEKNSEISKL